jgi:hypothetical protein
VLTVLVHVLGLGLIGKGAARVSSDTIRRRHPTAAFVMVIGATTLLATSLHGIEVGIWAAADRLLGALPDNKSAMLYSLNAITSYGHTNLLLVRALAPHGSARGAERMAAVRADARLSLRRDCKSPIVGSG